ncbi:hypothetical protein B296_00015863 [Ensete ventricosum]|uniref:Uncharacterized protein n=1 Tax=Ensete ventricosum TaxID=4639 RepID=A0A426Z9J8_ENSVE|nr:hypothetical protein B296_00015863 [Ensete ventricosum]
MHHNPIRRLQTTKPVTLVIRNARLKDTFSNRKKWRGGIRSPPTVNLPCWSSRKGPPSRPHPSTGFDLPSVFHRFIQDRMLETDGWRAGDDRDLTVSPSDHEQLGSCQRRKKGKLEYIPAAKEKGRHKSKLHPPERVGIIQATPLHPHREGNE